MMLRAKLASTAQWTTIPISPFAYREFQQLTDDYMIHIYMTINSKMGNSPEACCEFRYREYCVRKSFQQWFSYSFMCMSLYPQGVCYA